MTIEAKRVMAVDWGKRRIGVAISDPTRTIARTLDVIPHVSREMDAQAIVRIAENHSVDLIIVGVSYTEDQDLTAIGRQCARLADQIRENTDIQVDYWDEAFSTQTAKHDSIRMNIPKKKRRGHLDSTAAAIILQSFLDSEKNDL